MSFDDIQAYIPRLGNKFQILDFIYDSIRMLNIPQPEGVVDLFTGGGSFAYYMAQKGYKVIANDLDKDLIDLHNALKGNPEILEKYKERFVDKEEFDSIRKNSGLYPEFVRSVFSFSNKGTTYAFAKDKIDFKRSEFKEGKGEANNRIKHFEDIVLSWSRYNMQLDFFNKSYDEIEIPENYIVYCDIPYKGTTEYKCKGFDHEKFYAWALQCKNLVLISEYGMPNDFVLVNEVTKSVEANRGANTKTAVEKLYANKPVNKLSLF